MDELEYKAASKEWNHKFRFLKEPELEYVFLFILAEARSIKQIATIHSALKENQKIFRQDLITLQDFWYRYFRPKDGRHDQYQIKFFLEALGRDYNNTIYYNTHLLSQRKKRKGVWGDLPISRYILNSPGKAGKENAHFSTSIKIDDHYKFPLEIKCSLSKDSGSVVVRLITHEHLLTERVANFLSQLPPYSMIVSEFGGPEVDFCYNISAEGLRDKLVPCEPRDNTGDTDYICQAGFLEVLTLKIRNLGIPIDPVIPYK